MAVDADGNLWRDCIPGSWKEDSEGIESDGEEKADIPMMQKVSYQMVSYCGGAGRGEKIRENIRK